MASQDFRASVGNCSLLRSRIKLILTLDKYADDQAGLWLCGGAGQCTDEILQTVRDPTPLSALALSLSIIFD